MKVLLVYPQYTNISEVGLKSLSLSLVYLASTLESRGHKVTIYDASIGSALREGKVFHYGKSDGEVYTFLKSCNYDIVGITCSVTEEWKFVSRIAQQAKQVSAVPVAVGGLFATYNWEYCLRDEAVDIVMLGEAELSFAEIVENISKGIDEACRDVFGVAWKGGSYNAKDGFNHELDALPFPAWHQLDLNRTLSKQGRILGLPTPHLPILTSRSCPERCRFCNMYITHGRRWRARSCENVLEEMEYLIDRFDVRNFCIVDDNFSFNLERAKKICCGIIQKGLKIKYNFPNGISIKAVDQELVQLMKESGCISVCLAVESGSERIRNEVYGKNLATDKITEVCSWFRKTRIPTIVFLMLGGPTESRKDFEKTKALVRRLPVNVIAVNIYTPYPGTQLYEVCKRNNWLIEQKEQIDFYSPMLKTPDFGPKDIQRWKLELYFSFIVHHWPTLLTAGIIDFNIIRKFVRMFRF